MRLILDNEIIIEGKGYEVISLVCKLLKEDKKFRELKSYLTHPERRKQNKGKMDQK